MQILSELHYYEWLGFFFILIGTALFILGFTFLFSDNKVKILYKCAMLLCGFIFEIIGLTFAMQKHYRLRVNDSTPIGVVKEKYQIIKYDKDNDVFIVSEIKSDKEK